MQYVGTWSCAYDNDIIQLFEALADFTQPKELLKNLGLPTIFVPNVKLNNCYCSPGDHASWAAVICKMLVILKK